MWSVIFVSVILLIVYLLLMGLFLNEVGRAPAVVQVIIIIAASIIYLTGCYIYFSLKYPTLF